MGRPELAEDPRYGTHDARGERQAELDALIAGWTRTQDRVALGALLDDAGVPRGDIYRGPEMLEDAHFKARETIARVMHPTLGELRMQNVAPRLSETPGHIRDAGPSLGEHNDDVLRGLLGLDPQRLSQLQAAKVIGPTPRRAA
jgi:formyl-CoA transferase